MLPVSLSLLCFLTHVFALPSLSPAGMEMPLTRRKPISRTPEELGQWAKNQRDFLNAKYGGGSTNKRSTGTNLIVNQNADSSFYGSLAIGTPAVSYNVLLDTGSADLWIADTNCVSGCQDLSVPTFDASASSTFTNLSTAFEITYGSGAAEGSLGKDTVQMAGFSVTDQTFGVCDTVTSGLLTDPVSGLLGLAFQTIASSGATPLWQTLVESGAWDSPIMAFQLTRYINDASARSLEPGGSFSMGFANSTLYTGDIEYIDLPESGTYWLQSISEFTVQGSSVSPGTGSGAYAAIDTGTTLVGGPSSYMQTIYSNIPDSAAGTGQYEGYYLYPCDTTVNITISFGGRSWAIDNADFMLQQVSTTQCLGAFFDLDSGGSAPAWILGDTFLKNVYSVFRYNPAAVGFATLSDYALSLNDATDAAVPSATIGSVAATVSATSTSHHSTSDSASSVMVSTTLLIAFSVLCFLKELIII